MDLQKKLFDWQCKNFPQTDLNELSKEELIKMVKILQMTLGMCEEVGEIAHAVLKGTQKIREGRNGIDKESVADGFGDTYIYGNQLLSFLDLDVDRVIKKTTKHVLKRNWKENPTDGTKYKYPEEGRVIVTFHNNVQAQGHWSAPMMYFVCGTERYPIESIKSWEYLDE